MICGVQYYYDYPVPMFALPAISGLLSISLWGHIERMRDSHRVHWIQSRQEIQQLAVIAERERIARDLHYLGTHPFIHRTQS